MHAHEFLQRYGPAAVVTGASSGIGEAFAALLAKGGFGMKGAHVDNDPARMEEMIALNCTAPTLLARAFIPRLLAQ